MRESGKCVMKITSSVSKKEEEEEENKFFERWWTEDSFLSRVNKFIEIFFEWIKNCFSFFFNTIFEHVTYREELATRRHYEIFIYSCILIFFFFFFLYSPFNEYTCLHRYNGRGTTKIFFSRYPGDWIWIAWNIKVAFHDGIKPWHMEKRSRETWKYEKVSYSRVWIKHAIRVRRNRNYIWWYIAVPPLIWTFTLWKLRRLTCSHFCFDCPRVSIHRMGYSSREWKERRKKSNWTVIASLHRNWERLWQATIILLALSRAFFPFFSFSNDENNYECEDVIVAFSVQPWNRLHRQSNFAQSNPIIRFVVKVVLFWISCRLSRATVSQSENLNKWYLVFI